MDQTWDELLTRMRELEETYSMQDNVTAAKRARALRSAIKLLDAAA